MNKAIERANDVAVETMKQLLTLSAAVLALTITFVKELLGGVAGDAVWPYLLPASWLFLGGALWFSWIAMAEAGEEIAGSGGAEPHVFRQGSRPRKWASGAQLCFFLGLLCLAIFAGFNWNVGTVGVGDEVATTEPGERK